MRPLTISATRRGTEHVTSPPDGTVTFTVVSASGLRLACEGGNTVTVGTTTLDCHIPAGVLAAADSPDTVGAVYSGSVRLGPSTVADTFSLDRAPSTVDFPEGPSTSVERQPATFTATVSTLQPSPSPLTGTVTFTIVDGRGRTIPCTGGGQLTADRSQTCAVEGKYLRSNCNPYRVTATYSADADTLGSSETSVHRVLPPHIDPVPAPSPDGYTS